MSRFCVFNATGNVWVRMIDGMAEAESGKISYRCDFVCTEAGRRERRFPGQRKKTRRFLGWREKSGRLLGRRRTHCRGDAGVDEAGRDLWEDGHSGPGLLQSSLRGDHLLQRILLPASMQLRAGGNCSCDSIHVRPFLRVVKISG